jgi:alcohol dehydrogenase
LGTLCAEWGAKRVLLVSDPGVVAAGHTARGLESLRQAGIEAALFDGVGENPTTRHVESGVAIAATVCPDMLVGLGGGSAMDCAKGINFLFTNGGRMHDYWGVGKASRPMLPMIAVPTTAGTGSEAQSFALITDPETHVKMACGDKKAACRVALLDPELTRTQPARVTALTGLDALSHAIETYVTTRRNAVSLLFSREAWSLLSAGFARVIRDPADLQARSLMQVGAALAGLAIENSMLGAAHALANPLTARHDVVHGHAVALMLPHVIRFNGESCDHWYGELLAAGGGLQPDRGSKYSETLALLVTALTREAGLATRLAEVGVTRGDLPPLAADAAKQWTGGFNPRTVNEEALLGMYVQAL